jgi:steroid 5-alpha reductase family enzyme
MKKSDRNALVALPVVVLIAALFAVAGSQGGSTVGGLPVFALCVILAFVIQWVVFVPSYLLQTERLFDLTGGLTYITVAVAAALLSESPDTRAWLLAAMVVMWAVRLSSYLFLRIRRAGSDKRFDDIKPSFPRFLNTWTLQGLWVTITASAALAAITGATRVELGTVTAIGLVVWVVGIGLEIVADAQKSRFRADPANKGRFIHTGLWAWSRHPNYFGEITLWIGVAIVALPVLRGWQWVTLISPLFVILLLTRVSGVPLLEKSADKRWGGEADYEDYKARTPVLLPRPPRRDAAGGGDQG